MDTLNNDLQIESLIEADHTETEPGAILLQISMEVMSNNNF